MRVRYDPDTDTLSVVFKDSPIVESAEAARGLIVDLDADGSVVSLELLDASERVELPLSVELVAG